MKYAILILLWVSSAAGACFYGYNTGHIAGSDAEINRQVEIKQAIEETREIARQGAASEIAKIKVQNTVVQGKVTTLIRDNPIYRDCAHEPDGLRLINQALTGK